MSILKTREEFINAVSKLGPSGSIPYETSNYSISDEVKPIYEMILKHFALGDTKMQKPRVEFNDMSVIQRDQIDQMAFNTYQPNNGDAPVADEINSWKSRAMRPVVRNKCMSIAAHATAKLIFPKVFAFNKDSEDQKEAAQVMESLMEWSGDVANYPYTALMRVITAMASPASIGYTEYGEVTRLV